MIGDDPNGPYVSDLIGGPNGPDGNNGRQLRYIALYTAAARDYVDTALIVHVPLSGFSFDVNDLGLVGGVGFIVLLSMLLFSLKRELSNLITSFSEAKRQHQLRVFYDLLAMEQVLTVPEGLQIPRSFFLRVVPKVILCIPAAVYLCVVGHDVITSGVGNQINSLHTGLLYAGEAVLGTLIVWLTWSVVSVVKKVDDTWSSFFDKREPPIDTSPLQRLEISGSESEPSQKATL
jgi:hypothetical protein